MDPSSISSPSTPAPNAVPFAVEPNNHLPSPSSNHPPYAEMIYTAIEALKEKNGSSKRAISKYIEQAYSHVLPPPESHSNLLTHHLKRLKSDGLLQTIKNSYIIPRSATEPPSTASPSQPSKPRGRPRKSVTPTPAPAQAQPQPLPIVVADSNNNNNNNNTPLQNAEPVWAALGLSDEPLDVQAQAQAAAATPAEGSKRRPGRPPGSKNLPKNATATSPNPNQNQTPIEGQVPVPATTPGSRGRGRPPGSKSKSKKKPGRPPKAKTDTPTPAAVGSDGSKRRPGRPPKNQQQNPTPIPFATSGPEVVQPQVAVPEGVVPTAADGGAVLTPRSRGRPRKFPAVAAVPVSVVAGGGRGRGRGRGRGGRGRGGRVGNAFGGITLRAPGKRPVGRPKKGTTPATASQNAAHEVDLRRKLEHFQGKIKEALVVIKPHFDHQSPVTALAAIQELEILGAMDLNEPLKDDPQPNAPAQDQPQQAAAQPQVFAQYPPFQQDYNYQQHQSEYHP